MYFSTAGSISYKRYLTKMRDSVDTNELKDLLASLLIGNNAERPATSETTQEFNESDESDTDSDASYCVEEASTVITSDSDADCIETTPISKPPVPRRSRPQQYTTEIIDLAASSTDEEESEDGIWTIPSTTRKPINLIATSSDEEEEAQPATRKTNIVSSLHAILNRAGSPPHSTTTGGYPRKPTHSYPTAATPHALPGLAPKFPAQLQKPQLQQQQTPLPHTAFAKQRTQLATQIYSKYNALIFSNNLPADMEITWNKRLATTAGLTHYRREIPSDLSQPPRYIARIELSCKVLDTPEKLERTMVHEMCHCAAWLIDHVAKPPHGPVFKTWAGRAMRFAPHLDVSTCHQYDIFYSYQWQCSGCGQNYGRHSNSIDVTKKVCGVCKGRLEYLGKFDRGGTPARTRQPSAYNLYIKENFANAMKERGPRAQAGDVMRELNARWKAQRGIAQGSSGENIS